MSLPYRSGNGQMMRVSWDTDSLVRLDSINYDYNDFEAANKTNKEITNKMDKLFSLKKENFDLMMDNSLYPVYYLVNYDNSKVYKDSVDLIKFGDLNIDSDTLTFGIDLQLFNNIIFMIGNSDQMTTFNGSRNTWYKIMEAYSILVDKDERSLKYILTNKYKYTEDMIKKYRDDLEKYIFSFYEKEILSLMNEENCYDCFNFVKSLRETSLRKKTYSDLVDKFNDYITDLLISKIQKLYNSGLCADLFYDRFFAKEILALPDLNARKKTQIADMLYNFYIDCINTRIENEDYVDAKLCYDIIYDNRNIFDYDKVNEIESMKNTIETNYKNDSRIKNRNAVHKLQTFGNDILPKVGVFLILIGIIGIVGCIITLFKNIIWLSILIGAVVLLIVLYIVDKINTEIIKKKEK